MPLEAGKSNAAFQHNVKAEIGAGKPTKQAVAIAYAEKRKGDNFLNKVGNVKDSQNIISSSRVPMGLPEHPAKNQTMVGSRQAGPKEQMMTKNASIKHENPEFFKRQTDRKNADNIGMSHKAREFPRDSKGKK